MSHLREGTNMWKFFLFIFFQILLVAIAHGQGSARQNIDTVSFTEKLELVKWFVEYDNTVIRTTDSLAHHHRELIPGIGQEWFCYQDKKKLWHTVFGKFKDTYYDLAFNYYIDKAGVVRIYDGKSDTAFLNSHARALLITIRGMKTISDTSNVRFNQYIRQNKDKTIDVWFLPAIQPDGTAVYGGEFYFKYDATGMKLLSRNSEYLGRFLMFRLGVKKEAFLNYKKMEQPTLGSIYFAWYCKDHFPKLNIDTKYNYSSLRKDTLLKVYKWTHITKDLSDTLKK